MSQHPQFDEDFDLLALGALAGDEKQALELHLAGCSECAHKAHEARERMAILALAAPTEAPPAAARDRLLRRARADLAKPRQASTAGFRRWLIPVTAFAIVILVVLGGLLAIENRRLRHNLRESQSAFALLQSKAARDRAVVELLTAPDIAKVTLVSGTSRALPEGNAFYHPQKGLLFYAAHLPTLPATQTYQLWLVPVKGNPISAGTFEVDTRGDGQVLLPSLPAGVLASAFAVTIEPSGGVPQPTGPKILIGAVS